MRSVGRRHPDRQPVIVEQRSQGCIDDAQPGVDTGPILVAVDGNSRGWDALDWGAAEAAARGTDLRIIHVFRWPLAVDSSGLFSAAWNAEAQETAQQILEEAVRRARLVAPDVSTSTRLRSGARLAEVVQESRDDSLIVVGRSRPCRRLPWLRRTMSEQVARKACCAVAVVSLAEPGAFRHAAGRVLVGVDGSAVQTAALAFAFRAASRRRLGLTVLHASPPRKAQDRGATDPLAVVQCRTARDIQDALTTWQAAFPDVPVLQERICGLVGAALTAESEGAALVVFGTQAARWSDPALGRAAGRGFWSSVTSTVIIVPAQRQRGDRLSRAN
jgi:nucleotide-binding universal stress UspA family protein